MRRLFSAVVGLALIMSVLPAPIRVSADGSWLSAMPGAWNQRGASVPSTPYAGMNIDACKQVIRAPGSPEGEAVKNAGWHLYGARETLNEIVMVQGATDFDGQCRPLGSQAFVFVGGTFAGTLSPVTMDSRTDGMLINAVLAPNGTIYAEFSRYTPNDALCCPSSKTSVYYSINRNGPPVVIADSSTDMAADAAPSVTSASTAEVILSLSSEKVEPGKRFRVTVQAPGPNMERVWWWASDTADDDITGVQERTCDDAQNCKEEWRVSTHDAGTVIFHAKAVDKQGRESAEVTQELSISPDNGQPTLVMNVYDRDDDHFGLDIVAKGERGIERVSWTIVNSDGEDRRSREHDCDGKDRCEKQWEEKIPSGRKLEIKAVAVDKVGNSSVEVVKPLRGGGSNKNEKPTVELELSDANISNGDRLEIRVRAGDDHGVSRIVWWATDSDDSDLSKEREASCDEDESTCEKSWKVRPDDTGKVKIHARATDDDGRESDEVVHTLQIRR